MDKNTTAVQPLDLDKLSASIMNLPSKKGPANREFDHWYKIGHRDARHAAAELVNEHAAQARAATPESATLASQEDITGTTGASVKTWQERMSEAGWEPKHHAYMESRSVFMEAEIAALRAQLAAKGQGEPVAEVRAYASIGLGVKWLGDGPRPAIGSMLYLAAPASAQPDRGAAQDERVLFEATMPHHHPRDRNMPDGSYNSPYLHVAWEVWQMARAASPASQPVAPEGAQAGGLIAEVQGWPLCWPKPPTCA